MNLNVKDHNQPKIVSNTKAEMYSQAKHRMRLGKQLVYGGFVISIIGVVAYCAGNFNVTLNKEIGGVLYDNPGWLLIPSLGTIGLGTLVWLAGLLIHLKGAMDCDPENQDI